MTKQDYLEISHRNQDIFFALIRASIWTDEKGNPTDERLSETAQIVPSGYDWSPLITAFEQHAMLGVVAHAIMLLNSQNTTSQAPEIPRSTLTPEQSDHILSHVAHLVRERYKMRETVVSVFHALESIEPSEAFEPLEPTQITPILLKGEGLVALYPKNTHRSVGDIDILVPRQQYEEAVRTLQRISQDKGHEDYLERHYQLTYNGTTVEIHHHPGWCANGACEHNFQQLSQQNLVPQKCPTVSINGHQLLVPTSQYNALYIFNHLLHHLHDGGIGLRQFIDWALVLHEACTTLNLSQLEHDLRQCGLLRAWKIMGGILVLNLGLPQDQFPLYDQRLARKSQGKILRRIIEAGNFGFETRTTVTGNALSRLLQKTTHILSETTFLWTLFPLGALAYCKEAFRNLLLLHFGKGKSKTIDRV